MNALHTLLGECWSRLEAGAEAAWDPFHTGVLATVADGRPEARTVVLRAVDRDARHLVCHTDRRSAKVEALARNGAVAWVFYDPVDKVQLRLAGEARVHVEDALAETRWQSLRVGSRRCYLAEPAPGTPADAPVSGLPEGLLERRPTAEESAPGRDNFAAVVTAVDTLDYLHLRASGHVRARFLWTADGLDASWLIP